jgi:hypothetical protein
LRVKAVEYTGVDLNPRAVSAVTGLGARGVVCDVRENGSLPFAEILLMQASLYHFLPDARSVIDKMLSASTGRVIVAEPVRNLSDSPHRLIAWSARHLTNPGDGAPENRFTESSLDELFSHYASQVERSFLIPGGREKVYVLTK